uniref:STING ligand-binding domain-containing protein n=1 Tax=Anas zonorhyncha TaxID=75864 RepID=A0A8B9VMU3_9AVES
MTERSQQNVAHGLAWSYYVGYLKIVLPRTSFSHAANLNVWACRETWKLHILIPLSCNVWDDLEKADSNIQYLTDLTETTLTRGGIKKRVYKHSLYAIRDGDNQVCLAHAPSLLAPSSWLHAPHLSPAGIWGWLTPSWS